MSEDIDPADDRDHEREQVEQVFGLTGGELEDKPWTPIDATDGAPSTFRYWYDGAPEYDSERCKAHMRGDAVYRTVVEDCSYCSPEKELREPGERWVLDAQYVSSGETECPEKHNDDAEEIAEGERCPLCEGDVEEGHGYIYLGEGWCEVVYKRIAICDRCGADSLIDENGEPFCTCDHDYWPLDEEERDECMVKNGAPWIRGNGAVHEDTICKCSIPKPMECSRRTCRFCYGTIGAVPKSRVGDVSTE